PETRRAMATDQFERWRLELEEISPAPAALALPAPAEAAVILRRIAVPAEDIDEIVAALPRPDRDPDLWDLLARAHQRLTAGIGDDVDFRPSADGRGPAGIWPTLPA